jgi:hypothetical protein
VVLKRRIEQMADDLRKDQTNSSGDDETDRRKRELPPKGPQSRQQSAQRLWRAHPARSVSG